MQKKYYFWNNFRGILILLIVFGSFLYPYAVHLKGTEPNRIYAFLNLFCMPAFVFSYGYLSKTKHARSKTSQVTLLLYYVICNTVMMLCLYVSRGQTYQLLTPVYSFWFVLALIVWRMLAEPLSKVRGIIPFAAAVTLLMGFWEDFSNVLGLRMTVAYFVFFMLGYRFDGYKRMIAARSVKKYLIALAITAVGLVGLYFIVTHFTFTNQILQMGTYKRALHVLYRACMMGVSVAAIAMMMLLTPNANISIITSFGRNSMLILLGHRFFAVLFAHFLPYESYQPSYAIYAAIAAFFTCAVFGDSRLNKLVNGLAGKTALHLISGDRKGKLLRAGMMLMLLIIMAAIPVLERI